MTVENQVFAFQELLTQILVRLQHVRTPLVVTFSLHLVPHWSSQLYLIFLLKQY